MASNPSEEHLKKLQQRAIDFRDHESVSEAAVREWYEQFDESHRDLAVKVLENIRYVSTSDIRAMARALVLAMAKEAAKRGWKSIHIVPVGNPSSGSSVVVRAMKAEIKSNGIKGASISTLLDIWKLKPGQVDCVFIVDDFVGTGNTFKEWWETMAESLVLPLKATTAIGVLMAAKQGMAPLTSVTAHLFIGTALGDDHNVLSEGSPIFSKEHKGHLVEYCKKTGCGQKFVTGYGGCGLLVAFKHVCPNNSLPILWFSSKDSKGKKGWRPLFKRQAL